MTQKVHPTQGEASSQLTSGAIKWAAQGDWVVPSGTDYLAAFAGLAGTPLNGFQESHASDALDVTIDTGEAFVGGRWCAKDVTTTVTLASSTNNQTVYAGWESSTANSVVIGLDSAFSSGDDGRRTAIWEFDTDGSGVTNATRVHDTEPIHPHATTSDQLASIDATNYARTDVQETFNDTVIIEDTVGASALHVKGTNEIDSNVVTIDGDADVDQDDDILKVRSIGDPDVNTPTDSDSVLAVKGDGRVGVNRYTPDTAIDVDGTVTVRQSNSHIEFYETDDTGPQWRIEAQSGDFYISTVGGDEWIHIDSEQNHRVEMPGGAATQHLELDPRESAPPIVQNGTMAVQDGVNWNPAGTGELDLVVFLGGSWQLAT